MKSKPIVMIAIAVIFGGISIFVADVWLNSQSIAKPIVKKESLRVTPQIKFATIVVASKPLRYGDKIDAASLTEIPWPKKQLPQGAYKTVKQAISDGQRLVLTPIEANEPLLLSKLSGKDGRAALSNTLSKGMRAVSIAVDDVSGVAGFITPGDRVDIVLIRSAETMTADTILENVKVVSVDQTADERRTGAKIANAVTVEVSSKNAKKLALAKATGKLTLTLRAAGDKSITKADTNSGIMDRLSSILESDKAPRRRTVVVTRAMEPTSYSVVNEEYSKNKKNKSADNIKSGQ